MKKSRNIKNKKHNKIVKDYDNCQFYENNPKIVSLKNDEKIQKLNLNK